MSPRRLVPLLALVLLLPACRGGSDAPAPTPEAPRAGERPGPPKPRARRLPTDGLVQPQDLARYLGLPEPPLLVDVRNQAEFDAGHLEGALAVPVQELSRRLSELEAGRERGVIVYGRSGRRSRSAASILENAGFTDLARLDGDVLRWQDEGRALVRSEE